MANSITTVKGREKFAKAHAGVTPLPAIVEVGWGSGGHNPATGEPIPPTGDVNMIPGEFIRKPINGHSFPISTTLRLAANLTPAEGGANQVSCCGLYDEEDDLIAWKTFKPKGMDEDYNARN